MKKFILGFISGAILFSVAGALAASFTANPNPFPIKLNGNDVTIEGYNIEGSTYFKLRDIADVLGGFEVGFDDGTITLTSATSAPEQTVAPAYEPTASTSEPITVITDENGELHTSDGLIVKRFPEGDYVFKWDILNMMESQGIKGYDFGGRFFYKKGSDENILTDVPMHQDSNLLIPLNYYISTLKPLIDSLKEA